MPSHNGRKIVLGIERVVIIQLYVGVILSRVCLILSRCTSLSINLKVVLGIERVVIIQLYVGLILSRVCLILSRCTSLSINLKC